MNTRRVALVTGAGSGIGRAASVALSGAGYGLVLVGRREAALAETAALCSGESRVAPADLSDPAAISHVFDLVSDEFGRLDVLFNNAGMTAPQVPLEDLPLQAWQALVEVNLTAAFLATQHAFRLMKRQDPRGGRIINNGSISADSPRPLSVAYTATKHAITGLTKSTSLDGRAYGIACGQIDVGNARTALSTEQGPQMLQADGSLTAEPFMQVEDVGKAVLFMAELPLSANVQFMTVLATAMPYIGRG